MLGEPTPPIDRFFDALAEVLRNHDARKAFGRRILRICRSLCVWSAAGYLAVLLAALLFLHNWGDRIWFCFPFLYAPPLLFLLPVPVLAFPCLFVARKALLFHLASVFAVVVLYMGPGLPPRVPPPSGRTVRVLTNNIGQKNRKPLSPFVATVDPDIIALQDAAHRGSRYAKQYSNHQVVYHGEFVIASRFPVLDSGIVDGITCEGGPVAAWADVDIEGRRVRIVNVHIRTPRRILGRLMGLGLLKELVKTYVFFQPEGRSRVRPGIKARIDASRQLARFLDESENPLIVLGDFNFPDHGWQYRRIRGGRTDAFADAGKGYGFTFPGVTDNPLAFFRPWLRLDFVFASKHWRVASARTETKRQSQHRAVAAVLVLPPEETPKPGKT